MIVSVAQDADIDSVRRELAARGLWIASVERTTSSGMRHLVIAEHSAAIDARSVADIAGVSNVSDAASPHPLVDAQGAVVRIGDVIVGEGSPQFFCGPCSVESAEHIRSLADRLAAMGVRFLRGGAYKPRTSPYAFQGHGEVALQWMRSAADANAMKVVTEALGEPDVPLVAEYADVIQVGSRNMHNYALLKAIGRAGRPVLLKRGMSATVEEWLLSAEYLLVHGARGVIFCERGIRGFDTATRNLVDIGAVALLAHVHRLPVIVDPSHGVGRRDLVVPIARAAMAAGACGVMIETHDDPGRALSDGPQALLPETLREAIASMRATP